MTIKPQRNKADQGETSKERILASAESVFAEWGFDGASVRRISEEAGVPVALINYHFGSKAGLYRAIFEKRAPAIMDQRIAGLRLARAEPDLDRRIDLVVKALIYPMFSLRGESPSADFGRMIVREMSDPQSEARGIFRDMFDPVAEMLTDAISKCFPDWTLEEVHWAYHTMLGAMMIVMTDNGRMARLSGGRVSSDNWEEAARHMCAILVAGLKYRDRDQTRGSED
ncbi:CerR family C-terminal domain-containing protein [Maritimibacter sp. UBA3975]|uniref:TetR/AcrR family transcriptional regulator n=1 Tax=Maritimibacter sp. UBA3975 TaxID=1946833 RepID=UPI000C09D621|nr:CerR family C-terminal domain-containing protein [Maritimibacter sp. UBA3975]MAM63201.1 TetR family transcriptional regulator [Maritimibacter sp.]